MESTNEQIAMRISRNTIIGNVLLTFFKLFAGIFAHSAAMLSDAIHSLSDILATLIVMIGVKMANKSSDDEHQYGHERFECVASIVLAAILFATGLGIGWGGVESVASRDRVAIETPGLLALIAAITSIAVKEAMYWYTRIPAKKMQSTVLMANAWHHRSDAMSSVGSFIGIFGARLGFPILDPVACIAICAFILKVAVDIFRDAIGKMTDRACDDETADCIRDVILAQEAVRAIDLLKTRLFGDRIYVEVEISVDGSTVLFETHEIAHQVHDAIEYAFPSVKHCTVHVNPSMN